MQLRPCLSPVAGMTRQSWRRVYPAVMEAAQDEKANRSVHGDWQYPPACEQLAVTLQKHDLAANLA